MGMHRVRNERLVHANGVDLCVESFGDRADPAILLIMGRSAAMDWWEDELCERLAAGGRFVIRYDQRDTGQSVHYEVGAPQYDGNDLVADAIGLLDAFDISRAHIVGMSMGGAIAQVAALDHPDRLASLTLVATSPAGPDPDLPNMAKETVERFTAIAAPDWSDPRSVVDHGVELARVSAGDEFDEAAVRALWERVVARSIDVEASFVNPGAIEMGGRWRERLGDVRAPTLVIHGTHDPVFPPGHGEALANEIPDAELLLLEGAGHELPPPTWDVVVPAILRHTGAHER
jgi:pimeloyl-ACP methyl ester carboxylesterase